MKNSKRFHLGILPHVAMFLAMLLTSLVQAQELRTYFVTDPQGSPVIGTDAYANVVWSEDYLPYGERRYRSVSSGDNERWFTGAVQNEDTGLVDLGNRKYDPVLGRFLSIDPVGASAEKPFSVNRYAYANNNPYRYVDPQGDVPVDTIWDIGNVVYDLGKVTVGWTIGNQALVVEGLADAAIDTAAMLVPYVPAGSTKVARLAAKETVAAANIAKKGKGGESAAAAVGRRAHSNYGIALGAKYDTKVTLPSGRKPDAVNWEEREVRELKPDNARAVRRGNRQVEGYKKELENLTGQPWKSFVDVYRGSSR